MQPHAKMQASDRPHLTDVDWIDFARRLDSQFVFQRLGPNLLEGFWT